MLQDFFIYLAFSCNSLYISAVNNQAKAKIILVTTGIYTRTGEI